MADQRKVPTSGDDLPSGAMPVAREDAFEYAMEREAYYRRWEYSVSSHAEKAQMHGKRIYWLNKALEVLQREEAR